MSSAIQQGVTAGSGRVEVTTQRKLLFLVYSPLSSSSIERSLGMADYSYYFVMQRFLPLLREFGEVEVLEAGAH